MVATPKKDFMKRKYQQRKDAGLIEVKLYIPPDAKPNLMSMYDGLCDLYCVPEELRAKTK